jgi:hypothetical protein
MKTALILAATSLLAIFGGEALGAASASIPGTPGTILGCAAILLLVALIAWRTVRRLRRRRRIIGMDLAARGTESVSVQYLGRTNSDNTITLTAYLGTLPVHVDEFRDSSTHHDHHGL